MVIVSQSRKKTINFDQVIYIDAENIADRWQIHAYLKNNKLVTLGVFIAKRILSKKLKKFIKQYGKGIDTTK